MGKLSDITGDRVFEVLAEITGPIFNIAEDNDAAELFGRRVLPEGMKPEEYANQRIKRAMPVLMGKHKEDLVKICASIDGITVEEYKKGISVERVLQSLSELITDPTFNAFFRSAQSQDIDT